MPGNRHVNRVTAGDFLARFVGDDAFTVNDLLSQTRNLRFADDNALGNRPEVLDSEIDRDDDSSAIDD